MRDYRKLTLIPLFVMAALLCFRAPAFAKGFDKKTITFGAYFDSAGGRSSSQRLDMANILLKYVSLEAGVKFQLKTFASSGEVTSALLNNEIDSGLIYTTTSDDLLKKKDALYPWATYVMKNGRKTAFCLWERKDDAKKKTSDFKGARMLTEDPSSLYFIMLRKYLYDQGIDAPLIDVFSSFTVAPNSNSGFMALAMGDADVYWSKSDNRDVLKFLSPSTAEKLDYSFCSEQVYARGTFVLNRNTVSANDLKRLTDVLGTVMKKFSEYAKTDNDLKAILQYMKLAGAKLVPASPNEFEEEIKLFALAEKNGWDKEAKKICDELLKNPKGTKVTIKHEYGYCKAMCDKEVESKRVSCLKDCLK